MAQYVPTPEEIAARMAAQKKGVELKPLVQESGPVQPDMVSKDAKLLERQVKTLVKTVETATKKKRSAEELRQALDLLFQKYDFSPAEELINIAMELRDVPEKLSTRVDVLKELLAYTMPKLKSVETTGTVDHSHSIHIIRYGEDGKISKEVVRDAPVMKQVDQKLDAFPALIPPSREVAPEPPKFELTKVNIIDVGGTTNG